MSQEIVRGKEAVISFDAKRCIHSRQCVLNRPDVFVPNVQGEWIHPDRASAAELVELAHNCPSGAIRVETVEGAAMESAPIVNTVRLRENGPLALHGPVSVKGVSQGYRFTLCRCGQSKYKPYCDGSHTEAGFAASGEVTVTASEPLAARDGALAIDPKIDGPLHVKGNLEVVTGTGKTVNRVTECWLCRCGHSKNKPYCDGAHRGVGFSSES